MLDDIAAAESSVHINQFGFKPGVVGDLFAQTLVAKASEGVSVRLVVDNLGSGPDKGAREHYRRLVAGGVQVCVNRASKLRAAVAPLGDSAAKRWNLGAIGHVDHRKVVVVDGAVGWVGGAGIEDHFNDGRFHDLFVRLTGPVVAQLQLVFVASFCWLRGERPPTGGDGLFSPPAGGGDPRPAGVAAHTAPGGPPPAGGP